MSRKSLMLAVMAIVAATGTAEARDQIRMVGSSTVYPFATTVSEQFGKSTKFKTPVIESTGTGGGFKLFCAGVGLEHPDITNASRAIKGSEVETCAKNGVTEVTEVKIGYDGIVLANAKAAAQMGITRRQIFLALAKEVPTGKAGELIANPYKNWSDVDKALPAVKIEVLGPPPTSGTRDAFAELALEAGCETEAWIKDLKKSDEKKFKAICHGIREDGAYIEAGENDVLIVKKLEANRNAFGVFGYSFLDQNADKIQGSKIDGVAPTFETISNSSYPVSRPLFFYVKKAHAQTIPGIKEYLAEFTSDKAMSPEGYLSDKGLIPLPDAERKKVRNDAMNLVSNVK